MTSLRGTSRNISLLASAITRSENSIQGSGGKFIHYNAPTSMDPSNPLPPKTSEEGEAATRYSNP